MTLTDVKFDAEIQPQKTFRKYKELFLKSTITISYIVWVCGGKI